MGSVQAGLGLVSQPALGLGAKRFAGNRSPGGHFERLARNRICQPNRSEIGAEFDCSGDGSSFGSIAPRQSKNFPSLKKFLPV